MVATVHKKKSMNMRIGSWRALLARLSVNGLKAPKKGDPESL
jgi:hypothetical protein